MKISLSLTFRFERPERRKHQISKGVKQANSITVVYCVQTLNETKHKARKKQSGCSSRDLSVFRCEDYRLHKVTLRLKQRIRLSVDFFLGAVKVQHSPIHLKFKAFSYS
jgi:hypothetical protein